MLNWLLKLLGKGPRASAGERGEQLAADWLQRERGFAVITRNWRSPHDRRDEIDLVCTDGDVLVFVEVKARTAGALVPGYYAVDTRKKRVMRRTIAAYLRHLREKPLTFRFDVVEVSLATEETSPANRAVLVEPAVLHFENVPLFSKHFRA